MAGAHTYWMIMILSWVCKGREGEVSLTAGICPEATPRGLLLEGRRAKENSRERGIRVVPLVSR